MKSKISLLLFSTILLFISCGSCIEGMGDRKEVTLELSKFSKIELQGSSNVFVKQGDQQSVRVAGYQNHIDLLNKEVKDDRWEISFDKCVKNAQFEVFITIPDINLLRVKGSGTIKSEGQLSAKNMDLIVQGSGDIIASLDVESLDSKVQGSGDIKVSGKAKQQSITVQGSGDVNAYELVSEVATVKVQGSGDSKLHVTQELNAKVQGSGDIDYKGNPSTLNTNVQGSGDITPRK